MLNISYTNSGIIQYSIFGLNQYIKSVLPFSILIKVMSGSSEDEAPVSTAVLVKIYGENINKKYQLNGPMVNIGSHPKSHIKVDSINVSRTHCVLKCEKGDWILKDNNSQNGIYINGKYLERKQEYKLQCGDIFFLGSPSEDPQAFSFDNFPEDVASVWTTVSPQKEGALWDDQPVYISSDALIKAFCRTESTTGSKCRKEMEFCLNKKTITDARNKQRLQIAVQLASILVLVLCLKEFRSPKKPFLDYIMIAAEVYGIYILARDLHEQSKDKDGKNDSKCQSRLP